MTESCSMYRVTKIINGVKYALNCAVVGAGSDAALERGAPPFILDEQGNASYWYNTRSKGAASRLAKAWSDNEGVATVELDTYWSK